MEQEPGEGESDTAQLLLNKGEQISQTYQFIYDFRSNEVDESVRTVMKAYKSNPAGFMRAIDGKKTLNQLKAYANKKLLEEEESKLLPV